MVGMFWFHAILLGWHMISLNASHLIWRHRLSVTFPCTSSLQLLTVPLHTPTSLQNGTKEWYKDNVTNTHSLPWWHCLCSLFGRLSQSKQSRVYLPEEPFPHAHLVKSGRLKPFRCSSFTEYYNTITKGLACTIVVHLLWNLFQVSGRWDTECRLQTALYHVLWSS